MQNKILIFTTTGLGNSFPENFSCWCAGTLEAKGCNTEIIKLDSIAEAFPKNLLKIQGIKLKKVKKTLLKSAKLVLVLPEINNMLPASVDNFMQLLSKKKRYKVCKLVTIVIDSLKITDNQDNQSMSKFRYPVNRLNTLFGSSFSANRMQIRSNSSGDMCNLFAECHRDLNALIEQILDSRS
ncbi:NAD(P)H-dependent oxidoreductase [Cardinium endosymbiont of Tipula unca]|uniref:NAD(P)H-dependent oxidoreductase n=1 Tax=Cardinium endosymbiont of Tipula unca TaxID=3066216 RepID=UPI0030D52AE8